MCGNLETCALSSISIYELETDFYAKFINKMRIDSESLGNTQFICERCLKRRTHCSYQSWPKSSFHIGQNTSHDLNPYVCCFWVGFLCFLECSYLDLTRKMDRKESVKAKESRKSKFIASQSNDIGYHCLQHNGSSKHINMIQWATRHNKPHTR